GTLVRWCAGALVRRAEQEHGWTLQVVYPTDRQLKRYAPDVLGDLGYESGFRGLPKRWIVERTFAWHSQSRRLAKDYERFCRTSEIVIYVCMIRLMLRRLTRR